MDEWMGGWKLIYLDDSEYNLETRDTDQQMFMLRI